MGRGKFSESVLWLVDWNFTCMLHGVQFFLFMVFVGVASATIACFCFILFVSGFCMRVTILLLSLALITEAYFVSDYEVSELMSECFNLGILGTCNCSKHLLSYSATMMICFR